LDANDIPDELRAKNVNVVGNDALSIPWDKGHVTELFPHNLTRLLTGKGVL